MSDQRSQDHREVEKAAREAGPWTQEAEDAIAFLRELSARAELTPAELRALRVLRQREINEAQRLRQERSK